MKIRFIHIQKKINIDYKKETETLFVWEYQIKKSKRDNINNKTYINLIYNGPVDELTLTSILDTFSTWNNTEFYKDLPIFEMKCSQKLPMEETMVPIMKRKIMSYVFQVVNFEKINNKSVCLLFLFRNLDNS